MTCNMSATCINAHNIVEHNRDISLSKSPNVKWVPNQPKVVSTYGTRLLQPPPPFPMTGLYQYLRAGGWEKLLFKQKNWSSWDKALYKRRPMKIKYLACTKIDNKIHLQEAYRCQEKPIYNGIPLTPVSYWQNPSLLLLNYFMAYNRIYPDMSLTSIPLVSSWGGEVSPTINLSPLIGPPPFNVSNLNPPTDLSLTPKYSIDCLAWAPNLNHFPPIDITFDVYPVLLRPHKCFLGPSRVFVHNSF